MKLITTEGNKNDQLYVVAFGKEDVSANARFRRAVRSTYILHYALSGEGFFNGKRIRAGQGFFIVPGQVSEYHSSDDKPWKYFFVTVNGETAGKTIDKYVHTDENGIFEYDFKSRLLSLADSILSEEGRISGARSLGYFYLLMSFHEQTNSPKPNAYVREAKKYMDMNFYRNPSISEVAETVNVSDRYLYNLFIKHEGISPKKYLNNLKLARAKSMLKNTDYSISEIAALDGFSDVLAFSRFFSKNVGVSPTAYKKSIAE